MALLAAPACVIRLADRNSPIPNGGITGEPANCGAIPIEPKGAPGGAAEYKYVGRYVFLAAKDKYGQPHVRFDWSGNYIAARFEGTEVGFIVDGHENDLLFETILDGKVIRPPPQTKDQPAFATRVFPDRWKEGKNRYTVATGLAPGPHEIILHRNTEAQASRVTFKGFVFGPNEGDGTLLPPLRRARRIEIIGDSISCGYGNEGANATCPFDVKVGIQKDATGKEIIDPATGKPKELKLAVTENNYLAYGSIAGRELDADVTTICWSGKGVAKNYKERLEVDIDALVTIPDLWEKRVYGSLNVEKTYTARPEGPPIDRDLFDQREGEKDIAGQPIGLYDFSKERPEEQPQVVLINLATNDYARDQLTNATGQVVFDPVSGFPGDNLPDGTILNQAEKDNFNAKLDDLLIKVRDRRKNAHIILSLPPMLTNQFPFEGARDDLRGTLLNAMERAKGRGDSKVHVMEFVEQGLRYGLGCDYHPNLEVHRIMAQQMVGAIRSKTCW